MWIAVEHSNKTSKPKKVDDDDQQNKHNQPIKPTHQIRITAPTQKNTLTENIVRTSKLSCLATYTQQKHTTKNLRKNITSSIVAAQFCVNHTRNMISKMSVKKQIWRTRDTIERVRVPSTHTRHARVLVVHHPSTEYSVQFVPASQYCRVEDSNAVSLMVNDRVASYPKIRRAYKYNHRVILCGLYQQIQRDCVHPNLIGTVIQCSPETSVGNRSQWLLQRAQFCFFSVFMCLCEVHRVRHLCNSASVKLDVFFRQQTRLPSD